MTKFSKIECILVSSLKDSLFNRTTNVQLFDNLSEGEWNNLYKLSVRHGVASILFHVVSNLPLTCQPPRNLIIQWTLYSEKVYNRFCCQNKVANELSDLFRCSSISMLAMKGLSLADLYPIPSSRECGDIDIYTYSDFTKCNDIISKSGIGVDFGHEKHAVFRYNGILVENHQSFLNLNTKTDRILNDYLFKMSFPNSCRTKGKLLFPNANFNAVFLLRHMSTHFAHEGATLRNLIDWGLFLYKESTNINRPQYIDILSKSNMVTAFNVFTAVSSEVIGVDFSKQYIGEVDTDLVDKVMRTILDTTLHSEYNYNFFLRFFNKTLRLLSSRWIYKELLPDSFWYEIVFHSAKVHIVNTKNI